MLAPRAYILRRNPWPRQRVQLRWKAEVTARPAYNLLNFERYIEFLRCQDNEAGPIEFQEAETPKPISWFTSMTTNNQPRSRFQAPLL